MNKYRCSICYKK